MRFLEWVLTLYDQYSYTRGNLGLRNILWEEYHGKMKVDVVVHLHIKGAQRFLGNYQKQGKGGMRSFSLTEL